MNTPNHFAMLARYNRVANEHLYEKCAQLDDTEYRKPRAGSFGCIHALLNHLLLSDRIWMSRFEGGGQTTPPLNTVLYDDLPALRAARAGEDARIESFFVKLDSAFLEGSLHYINSQGKAMTMPAFAAVPHLFNHQTHHRGQVHVMLSQTPVAPPALDLIRLL